LALASLTGGDRSIGIVRLRTKTTEFFFIGNTRNRRIWHIKVIPITFQIELTISSVSVPCPGGEVKARDTLVHLQ
jgi:hypothetical protein